MLLILFIEPLGEGLLYFQYQNGNRNNWKAAFPLIQRYKQLGDPLVLADKVHDGYYLHDPTGNIYRMKSISNKYRSVMKPL